jgi:predicted O-methyltransferase YrrM
MRVFMVGDSDSITGNNPEYPGRRSRGFFKGRRRIDSYRGEGFGFQRYGIPSGYQTLEVANTAEAFIKKLIKIASTEIEQYNSEITLNTRFHEQIREKRMRFGRGFPGIGSELGVIVYIICRKLKPDAVVETGVSSGISSAFILCALEDNKHGKLYSVDLAWGGQSGWIIPDFLRHRWHLELGSSSEKLSPLLEKSGEIDIFLHDSEHSYRNMLWEYQTAWKYLKPGGILLSHNVNHSQAFPDFCNNVSINGFIIADMGGITKEHIG